MNDFTKEELELILHKFGQLRFSQFEGLGMLSMKINNMIEDYCEHVSLFSMDSNKHCCKCGKWFNDNQ